MKISSILLEPVLTEKATNNASKQVYTFYVHEKATKHTVKSALESLYKIKIRDIHMAVRKGKTRRTGRRLNARQLPDRKIAYIYVKEGSIDLFPKA